MMRRKRMLSKKVAFVGVAVLIALTILSAVFVQSVIVSTGNSNVTFETNRTVISGYPGLQGHIVNVTINNVSIAGPYNITVNLTLVKPVAGNISVEINDSRSPSGWSVANLTEGANQWGQLFFFNNSLSFQVGSVITFRINMTTYVPTSTGWNMYVTLADSASSNNVILTPQTLFYIAGINISSPLNNTNLTTRTVSFTYYSDSTALANCTVVVNDVANATVLATNNTATLVNITAAENANGNKNASTITVSCYDAGLGQNVTTGINFFDLDVTPPVVSLVTANNSIFNSPNITLEWAASDNLRSNLSCQVFLDAQLNFSVYQSNSSAVVNLSAGEHTWSVNCTDSGFFSTTPIALFTIDLSAPSIAPLSLNDTIIRNNSVVNLTFSYNESSILYVNLSLGNVSNLACTNGTNKSCSALVTLYNQSGNVLNLTMTDFGGLMTSVFTTYTVDDQPPGVVAISPLTGFFNISGLSLVLNATDNFDTSINCTFYQNNVLNGSISINGSGIFNMTFSEGASIWNASCIDDADNVNLSAASAVIIDLSTPSIDYAALNDTVVRNDSVVNLTINYTETYIQYVNITGSNVSSLTCPNGTSQSCSALVTLRNESGNQLNLSITDFSGRISFSLVNYTVDGAGPTVTLLSPNGSYYNVSSVALMINATDNLDTSINCSFYQNETLNGSILVNGLGVFNTTWLEGSRGWNVSCIDDAQNTALSAVATVVADFTNPAITGVAFNGSVHKNGTVMTLTVNYTELNLFYINISGDGFASQNLSCTTSGSDVSCVQNLTVPQLSGQVNLTVAALDLAQRTNFTILTYTVNLTINSAPSIASASFNDTVFRNNSIIAVSLTYSENDIQYINISGGNFSTPYTVSGCTNGSSQTCAFNFSIANGSQNMWNVTITDSIEQKTFVLLNYTIDDTAPQVVGIGPTDYVWSNASTQGLIVNATDYVDTAINCTFYQNDTFNGSISINGLGVFNTSFLAGERGWNVSCKDDADNVALTSLKFIRVDLTSPTVASAALNATSYFNGSTISINLTYTELNVQYINITGGNMSGQTIDCNSNGSSVVCQVNVSASQNAGANTLTFGITDFAARTNLTVFAYSVNFSSGPQITINSPADGAQITDVDGNVTFNITLTGSVRSTFKVVIDGSLNSSFLGNATMTIVNFTSVSPGTHSFYVYANDSIGNAAVTSTRTFIYIRNVSFNEEADDMRTSFNITNVTFKAPDGTVAQDGYLNASYNASLDVNISTGIVANVTFSFDASDANWNKTRSIVFVGNSSANASAVRSILGITPGLLVMFHNFNAFLNQSDYNTVAIIINQSLGGRTVFYIDSDVVNQSTVFILPQCSGNANPSVVSGISQACYTNGTLNTTLWVPHLSGGGLGDDAFVPNVSIASPLNSSVQADSVVSFILRVNESNPAQQFCNFTVINSSNVATIINTSLLLSDFVQVTNATWQYQSNFTTLSNSTYNISVQCVDLNGRIGNLSSVFNITDTTPPSVSDAASSVTTTTATITWNTHERANESINISGTLYTDSDSNVNATSHSLQVTGLTASTSYNYAIVSCDLWLNCNNSVNGTFTTSTASSSASSSSSGGGGGGSGSGLMSGSSVSRIWSSLPIGFTDFSPDSAAIAVSQVRFSVNAPQRNVYFALSDLGSKLPGSILKPSTHVVYRYIDISPTNLDEKVVSQATITFRVERSWIIGQGLPESNVVLLRWVSGKWTALPTQRIGANATTATYRADTPGFSTFAIAAARPVAAQPQAAPPVAPPEVVEPQKEPAESDVTPPVSEPVVQQKPSSIPAGVFWAITAVVILIIVGAYFFINRKEEKF